MTSMNIKYFFYEGNMELKDILRGHLFSFLMIVFATHSSFAVASNKRALVTGGAGFVGSHLCKRLVEENYEVICIDNLMTGSMENISHLLDHPNFKFLEHDITHPFDVQESLDEIYNLACAASPKHYQRDPIHTVLTNVLGAMHVLEIARRNNAKIFQASTSEVYGDPTEHPQNENYRGNVNPDGPRACYDEGKRCAETLFFDFYRMYGVKIKVGRIFNTYGPKMDEDDGRVVSNFIMQALRNQPITVYGQGAQTRSFCYISDLINAIRLFMDTDDSVTGPVNLGNPEEQTIQEFAMRILQLVPTTESKIIYLPLPQDDPRVRCPDITRARKFFGWEPQVDLVKGLQSTFEYFANNQSKIFE